ncbi:hypothetical protein [Schlesneria paludicola]|uniref:hypothetical protein n=1 Tax=Schlesneria paludicola TaxID=360056 RepID=UPI000492D173|nr:hypothetical protein [Schlesneria paludicola]
MTARCGRLLTFRGPHLLATVRDAKLQTKRHVLSASQIMREFFRGWKRKLGVVTLVMACMLAILWVRSLCVWDGLQFCSGKDSMENFVSVDQSLIWGRLHIENHELASMTMFHVMKSDYMPLDACLKRMALNCTWYGPGFGVGAPPLELRLDWGFRSTYWIIPYWSLVIPLTLLSACLLFSKPRATVQPD